VEDEEEEGFRERTVPEEVAEEFVLRVVGVENGVSQEVAGTLVRCTADTVAENRWKEG
jgi:hypothetical protein